MKFCKNVLDKICRMAYSMEEKKKAMTKRSTHCPLPERAAIREYGC